MFRKGPKASKKGVKKMGDIVSKKNEAFKSLFGMGESKKEKEESEPSTSNTPIDKKKAKAFKKSFFGR